MTTGHAEQLTWERRAGRYAAVAAALSALFFVAGSVYFGATVQERPQALAERLMLINRERTAYIVSSVLVAVAYLVLPVALGYLYRATKHRRAQTPSAVLPLLIFGAVVAAGVGIARQVEYVGLASDFLAQPPAARGRAQEVLAGSPVLQVLGLASNFALGLAVALTSVNAIRAGTLSTFMGILGVTIGALIALPLLGAVIFILLFFWLLALAVLFLDRWPGGRGPAWETGEAIRWPSVRERNEQLQREREELDAGRDRGGEERPAPADPDSPAGGTDREGATGSESSGSGVREAAGNGAEPAQPAKRKRGRRRR